MAELWKLNGWQIADGVRSGRFSALEVTHAHLERIRKINPSINAIVQHLDHEAIEAARQVDETVQRNEDPGPLCGVPVTIKVNIDQKGQATTNGLTIQKDLIAGSDNPVVTNIRKAGAVIVGRTNTPAFSLRWFTKNALHGQTLNPRDGALTPGGSSGGAAAAVAAGLCAIGQGTDIAGSIRYPAYACGLHGLRPSLGRVPACNATAPDRFIGAQVMAVSGPIARSIQDIRIAFQAMSRPDPRDPWYTNAPLDGPALPKRAALSIQPEGMTVAPEVRAALEDAAQRLRAAGWQVDEVAPPPIREAAAINATLWMAETRFAAQDMFAREADADAQFVYDMMARDAGEVGLGDLMKAMQRRSALIREWELFLSDYPVLICPVSGSLPFEQQLDVRSQQDFAHVFEAQVTQRALPTLGLPGLAVATGALDAVPVGVQLIGGRFREDILLEAGAAIEARGPAPMPCDPR